MNMDSATLAKLRSYKWILRDVRVGYILAIALFYVSVNVINYLWTLSFQYQLPPVDVVHFLAKADDLPVATYRSNGTESQMFHYSHDLLVNLLKDVYIRGEEYYLEHKDNTTIVVEPVIKWTPKYIRLALKEGVYHFANRTISFPKMTVTNVLNREIRPQGTQFDFKSPSKSAFDLQAHHFVSQFIHSLFHFTDLPLTVYDVSIISGRFYFMKIGALGILLATLCCFLTILLRIWVSPNDKTTVYGTSLMLFISTLGGVFFQIFNLTLAWIIFSRFPSLKQSFIALFYLLEAVIFISIVIVPARELFFDWIRIEEKDDAQRIIKKQEPTPTTSVEKQSIQNSSIYSEISAPDANEATSSGHTLKPGDTNEACVDSKVDGVHSAHFTALYSLGDKGRVNSSPIVPVRNHTAPVFRSITELSSPLIDNYSLTEAASLQDHFKKGKSTHSNPTSGEAKPESLKYAEDKDIK